MKMVMISYNSSISTEVMEMLDQCGLKNFTKWERVQGKGTTSGPHYGSEVWPGENSVILCATNDSGAKKLIECVKCERKKLGSLGIKAFVWPIEDIT